MNKFNKNKYRFSSIKPLILTSDEVIKARDKEITMLSSELLTYKVLVRDLVKDNVSYSVRNELLNIAMFIANNDELYNKFIEREALPLDEIHKQIKIDLKYIKKYKEYLITYILILGNQQYKHLESYLQIVEGSAKDVGSDIIEYKSKDGLEGVILESGKKNAIVMTSLGEFKKLKVKEVCLKGQEIKAIEKKSLKDYKLYVSILSIFALLFILSMIYKYNGITRTVVVETTSPIKLEINGFDRVLSVSSNTERGKKLVSETNVLDNNVDDAIYKIIKYANENEMVKSSGIVVTVTGKALKHNSLDETAKFVYKEDLKVRLNNAGAEHKLN